MAHLRIGGVPEHFNYPWHVAQEHQLLEKGISFTWCDFPGGTGAMCRALHENEIDLALMLTEGAVADIIHNDQTRIVGTYVESPLTWGIHVKAESQFTKVAELAGQRFAISRYQSGSHLMAVVHARQQAWNPNALRFEVVGNFEGARRALREGKADAFMWEKFTTKPTVDRGEWRRIGECPTPWPCFVIVGRKEPLPAQQSTIETLLRNVQGALTYLSKPERIRYIAAYYNLEVEDVAIWYDQTQWNCTTTLSRRAIHQVQEELLSVGVIPRKQSDEMLVSNFTHWKT